MYLKVLFYPQFFFRPMSISVNLFLSVVSYISFQSTCSRER